ncbi:putative transposase-like protein [Trichonephila clavipes]|nr:putative transposase-like protein [Trichonephila clavipes]
MLEEEPIKRKMGVCGGTERNSHKCFFKVVPRRMKESLLAMIKEWMLSGTTIISDCWASSNCLEDEGFQHLKVNHSPTFVCLVTGASAGAVNYAGGCSAENILIITIIFLRCSACQASPENILDCLGFSKQDLYEDPPMVLGFLRVNKVMDLCVWTSLARHGDEQQQQKRKQYIYIYNVEFNINSQQMPHSF